ncbi:nucleotidyltransferase family protein [Albibacterium profundi]|uniref:Nucleotidyltransferase domain-containing protein n=1 Tax=Albibacterium profundi TaxID=3134906 RepID=A0ABV5CCV1_9SPHI
MKLTAKHIAQLKKYFTSRPVKRAYLFGSYSRNEALNDSDVDILVELDHSQPIGLKFFIFKEELENILKRKVDLISSEGISPYIKNIIDEDKVLIYEE